MPETRGGLSIRTFPSQKEFEHWLERQAADAGGLWLRFAKKGASFNSVSKAEAIDSALCHGWIDGQLDKFDDESWLIRFTPRQAKSKLSQKNCTRIGELEASGRMRASGLAAVAAAKADGRWDAAYAPASSAQVPDDLQAALDLDPAARQFFAKLTGANRYAILYRIGSVKKAETRARKIREFVAMLARGETVHG